MALPCSDVVDLIGSVYRGRWFMMYASLMIMSAAGATYVFAVYSKDIKYTLGYNQEELNRMGFFKDLGANFGIISGLFNEVMPGPWVVLIMGSFMNFAGYFLIYLAINGRLGHPKLWQMCLYIAIGANSQGFANTGTLVPCVKNFPESRGIVLGLLKGFVGLSGAIFTQLYHAVYGEDSKSLVLLIAWLPAVLSLISVHSIRDIKVVRQPNEFNVFCSFLYVSIAIAVYLLIVIAIQKTMYFPRQAYIASAVVILLLLLVPLVRVFIEGRRLWIQKKEELKNPPPMSITIDEQIAPKPKSSTAPPPTEKGVSFFSNIFNPPPRGQDYTILQAVCSIDMIMIFISTAIGTGGTLAAQDNMGQIGESLGYENKSIGTFVTLMSIWSYAGRVAAGFVSETLILRYKWPRPLIFSIILFLSSVGHLLIALPTNGSIYAATVILGFTFGAQMPLFLAMISELFGLKYYSTLFNVGVLSSPLGSYVFNVKITGRLYDQVARRQKSTNHLVSGALTCLGVECYKLSFIIITVSTLFAAILMLVLSWRTKEFYRSDIYAKFRQEAEGEEKEKEEEEKEAVSGAGEDIKKEDH